MPGRSAGGVGGAAAALTGAKDGFRLKSWIIATVVVFVPLAVVSDFAPEIALGIAGVIALTAVITYGQVDIGKIRTAFQ